MFQAQHGAKPFQRPQDATRESVMDARIAEQTDTQPDTSTDTQTDINVVDTIQAARDTAAALPIPIPTAPAMRDALEQAAKEATEQDGSSA